MRLSKEAREILNRLALMDVTPEQAASYIQKWRDYHLEGTSGRDTESYSDTQDRRM